VERLTKFPLHLFLVAIYPILALWGHNIDIAQPAWVLRPLLVSLAAASVLLLVIQTIVRAWEKAALITSLALVLFFSYGHVYTLLEPVSLNGFLLGRHRYLAPLWGLLLILEIKWALGAKRDLTRITAVLNTSIAIALIFSLYQLASAGYRALHSPMANSDSNSQTTTLNLTAQSPSPDIYYLILDGYGRDDMLRKHYDLDNRPFLDWLRSKGFYVAVCSQSNYAQTQLSLASSLNFDYLANLDTRYTAGNTSRLGLPALIQHSALRQALESLGYRTITFESGYPATEIEDADQYYATPNAPGLNDFEHLLVRTTAGRIAAEGIALLGLPPDWEARDQTHRARIRLILDTLPVVPETPGPKFVFAHIIAPHWPHVFGPDGEPVHERPDSVSGYRNQVLFINREIKTVISAILQKSSVPPIIILQADHGAVIESPAQRMSILNAYYLPGNGSDKLYARITPVNTFRLVLNEYFGARLPLREDFSYYSTYETPYEYQVVPLTRTGCE